MSTRREVPPQPVGGGDPVLVDYYRAWVDNIADDATVEARYGMAQHKAPRTGGPSVRTLYGTPYAKYFSTPT